MSINKAGQGIKLWQFSRWVCSCGLTVRFDDTVKDREAIEQHLLQNPIDTFQQETGYTILSRDGRPVIPDLPAQVPIISRQDEPLISAASEERPVLSAPEFPEVSIFAVEQPVLPSPEPGVFTRMVGAVKRTLGL